MGIRRIRKAWETLIFFSSQQEMLLEYVYDDDQPLDPLIFLGYFGTVQLG